MDKRFSQNNKLFVAVSRAEDTNIYVYRKEIIIVNTFIQNQKKKNFNDKCMLCAENV